MKTDFVCCKQGLEMTDGIIYPKSNMDLQKRRGQDNLLVFENKNQAKGRMRQRVNKM